MPAALRSVAATKHFWQHRHSWAIASEAHVVVTVSLSRAFCSPAGVVTVADSIYNLHESLEPSGAPLPIASHCQPAYGSPEIWQVPSRPGREPSRQIDHAGSDSTGNRQQSNGNVRAQAAVDTSQRQADRGCRVGWLARAVGKHATLALELDAEMAIQHVVLMHFCASSPAGTPLLNTSYAPSCNVQLSATTGAVHASSRWSYQPQWWACGDG